MKITINNKINLIIDIAMFVIMMAIAGIGLMLKYVLLAGYKVNEVYGEHFDLKFAHLDRHEWGSIHLLLGYILLILLVLHLLFHYKMIVCLWCKTFNNKLSGSIFAVSLLIIACLLLVGPLFITPQVSSKGRFLGNPSTHVTVPDLRESTQIEDESLAADSPNKHLRKHRNRHNKR